MDDKELNEADRIDRYLRGEMNADEKKAMESDLSSDPALKDKYENIIIAQQAIQYDGLKRDVDEIRQSMLSEDADIDNYTMSSKEEVKQADSPLPIGMYALRVAASLLIILVAFATLQMSITDPSDLYDNKVNYEVVDVVERSGQESESLSKILEAYQTSNYQDAVAFYTAIDDPTTKESYIAAAAYLKLESYPEAQQNYIKILEGTDTDNKDYWQQKAAYNLAITDIKLERYNEAIRILVELKSDEEYGDYYDQLLSDYTLWKLRLLSFKNFLFD